MNTRPSGAMVIAVGLVTLPTMIPVSANPAGTAVNNWRDSSDSTAGRPKAPGRRRVARPEGDGRVDDGACGIRDGFK
jgi:hypothetical protein